MDELRKAARAIRQALTRGPAILTEEGTILLTCETRADEVYIRFGNSFGLTMDCEETDQLSTYFLNLSRATEAGRAGTGKGPRIQQMGRASGRPTHEIYGPGSASVYFGASFTLAGIGPKALKVLGVFLDQKYGEARELATAEMDTEAAYDRAGKSGW